MKSPLRFLLASLVAVIPVVLCGLVVWLPVHANDLRLEKFAKNLYHYPLPPETTVLNQHALLRKVGNGNNCLYEVRQLLVSTLPRGAIEQYYEGVTLPRVSFRQWDEVYDSPTVTPIHLEFDEVQSNETQSFFAVSLSDIGLDIVLDVRCH